MKLRPPVYVFTDLDDTLFSSAAKSASRIDLEPAALLENGQAQSYISPPQQALLAWLYQGAKLIPVTGRSVESFGRLVLSLPGPAIVGFGGVILNAQRQSDPIWARRMQPILAQAQPRFTKLRTGLADWIVQHRAEVWVQMVVELGQEQYLLAQHRHGDLAALAQLASKVLQPWVDAHPGWRLFQNDNSLIVLPPNLDKADAVQYMMEQLRSAQGEIVTVGVGGNLSDVGFLQLCDYRMVPAQTALAQRSWGTP
jgi:hydroxymethylpyrimidine pyrophosphatase-like HAD family hydrolase